MNKLRSLSANALLLFFVAAPAPAFDTVINVPPEVAPSEIGSSTQLNLGDGGVLPDGFRAGALDGSSTDVEVNISGGTVGDDLVATNSVVNISRGTLGDFFAESGSTFNISGGTIEGAFSYVQGGSQTFISGGQLDTSLRAWSGSEVTMTGGILLGGELGIRAEVGSTFRILGGTVGDDFSAQTGSTFELSGGTVGGKFRISGSSNASFHGGEFMLNGSPYTGTTITLELDDIFTGTLADGSPFIFRRLSNQTAYDDRFESVSLTSVLLPTLDTTPMVVDASNPSGPAGLRAGQTLTLRDGGVLGGNFASVNGTLNIEGGNVGRGLEAYNSTVNISGGLIGIGPNFGQYLELYTGSQATISGGEIYSVPRVYEGATLHVDAGLLKSAIWVESGGVAEIAGGRVERFISIADGGVAYVSGGNLDGLSAADGGVAEITGGAIGQVTANTGSDVTLFGGDFELNGASYTGATITLEEGDFFTGTLADGSVFAYSEKYYDYASSVRLSQTALPAIDTTPIVVDSPSSVAPYSLRPGQSLTLRDGGELGPNFTSIQASIEIEGGTVGKRLEVVDSDVQIHGGSLEGLIGFQNSSIHILGGEFSSMPLVGNYTLGVETQDSDVEVAGGSFLDSFRVANGELHIHGGVFQEGVVIDDETVAYVDGGTIAGAFVAAPNTQVHLFGTEFTLDGQPIAGLVLNEAVMLEARGHLSGTLADGSVFAWPLGPRGESYLSRDALVTITLVNPVPEPATASLVATALATLLGYRRLRSKFCAAN